MELGISQQLVGCPAPQFSISEMLHLVDIMDNHASGCCLCCGNSPLFVSSLFQTIDDIGIFVLGCALQDVVWPILELASWNP